jgi:hypothetical protein
MNKYAVAGICIFWVVCCCSKGEFEDLLRKGQLRGENEKKNVSDVFMMTLNW